MTSSGTGTGPRTRDWSSRLESWKEIAAYLGRDVRTAIRWERERGLPVHRVPGGRRQAVYAFREELDAWMAGHATVVADAVTSTEASASGHSESRAWRRWRLPLIAAASLALVVLAAVAIFRAARAAPINSLRLDAGSIVALDQRGRERWRYQIPEGGQYRGIEYRLVDFARTGQPDLVVLLSEQALPTTRSDRLLRFSTAGELKWSIDPTDGLTFGATPYSAPWFSGPWMAIEIDGQVRIIWAVRHLTWWPSMLLTYDAEGHRIGAFVNGGWIRSIGVTGTRIVFAGVSNSAGAGMAALIDARRPSGASPEDPSSPFFCGSCPQTPPLRYVTFGRSEINRAAGHDVNAALVQRLEPDIEIRTLEASPTSAEAVYEMSPDLALVRARFGDRYWDLHRRMENEGRLSHTVENCPEQRAMPAVRTWSPGTGWQPAR